MSGASLQASDLLELDSRTTGLVQVTQLQALYGTPAERNQVFHASGLQINLVDDQPPLVAQLLSTPMDGLYGIGQPLIFQVGFDESIQVSGVPVLQLSDGLQATFDLDQSNLVSGRLAFSYKPQNGDRSTDLRFGSNALVLSTGAMIADLSGNAASLQVPLFDAAVVVDGRSPQLLQLNAGGGTYGPNRTLSFELQFNEPVRWQAQNLDAVPILQLSQGLSAAWVPPPSRTEWSTSQRFDLLTGSSPPQVSQLQVLGLSGMGQFSDAAGNGLAAPQSSVWSLPQTISLTSKQSWNLDVDGDGRVTALGDGLMVIRKLFGNAFAGDALTAKALSQTATRSSTEIHSYIQQAIDQGLLDIDHDDRTTALGDGLMLIRQLFGGSFAGEALINKAISQQSSLIPLGQTLAGLDAPGRAFLADQVRSQITALMPTAPSAG